MSKYLALRNCLQCQHHVLEMVQSQTPHPIFVISAVGLIFEGILTSFSLGKICFWYKMNLFTLEKYQQPLFYDQIRLVFVYYQNFTNYDVIIYVHYIQISN